MSMLANSKSTLNYKRKLEYHNNQSDVRLGRLSNNWVAWSTNQRQKEVNNVTVKEVHKTGSIRIWVCRLRKFKCNEYNGSKWCNKPHLCILSFLKSHRAQKLLPMHTSGKRNEMYLSLLLSATPDSWVYSVTHHSRLQSPDMGVVWKWCGNGH